MSKALGGAITRNPVKEIGWGEAVGEDDATARHWLGAYAGNVGTVFHWHGETFSIPPGADPPVRQPRTAPTRCSPSARTSACNAMSR